MMNKKEINFKLDKLKIEKHDQLIAAIGSDHTGIFYKKMIKKFLIKRGYKVKDFGSENSKEKVDYPDFIHPVASFVDEGHAYLGIVICGSGNGAAITANKHDSIRAALVWNKKSAFLAKKHNNANIISLPSRFIKKNEVLGIVDSFIRTNFEGGRHEKRIDKIHNTKNKNYNPQ